MDVAPPLPIVLWCKKFRKIYDRKGSSSSVHFDDEGEGEGAVYCFDLIDVSVAENTQDFDIDEMKADTDQIFDTECYWEEELHAKQVATEPWIPGMTTSDDLQQPHTTLTNSKQHSNAQAFETGSASRQYWIVKEEIAKLNERRSKDVFNNLELLEEMVYLRQLKNIIPVIFLSLRVTDAIPFLTALSQVRITLPLPLNIYILVYEKYFTHFTHKCRPIWPSSTSRILRRTAIFVSP